MCRSRSLLHLPRFGFRIFFAPKKRRCDEIYLVIIDDDLNTLLPLHLKDLNQVHSMRNTKFVILKSNHDRGKVLLYT